MLQISSNFTISLYNYTSKLQEYLTKNKLIKLISDWQLCRFISDLKIQ